MTGKPRTRWFRFSLRTLLAVVTLASVWLGWWCYRAREQQASVEAVQQLGGWVYYDFQLIDGKFAPEAKSPIPQWLLDQRGYDYFHNVVQLNLVYNDDGGSRLDNHQTTDAALAHLRGFPNLKRLLLHKGQASDDGLKHVGELLRLEDLYMWDATEVTDEGISHLSRLKRLKYLHCGNSQITDESLRILSEFPRLKGLSLQGHRFTDEGLSYVKDMVQLTQLVVGAMPPTKEEVSEAVFFGATDQPIPPIAVIPPARKPITDDGLLHVKNLVNLELLDLQNTEVTSAGLKHLAGLRNLKDLWLSNSAVTDTSAIKTALPSCKVIP